MKNKTIIQERIIKLQEELKQMEAKEEAEKNKVDFIVINGYAYETKDHDFDKHLKDMSIPKNKELWTSEDCIKSYNNLKFRKLLNLNDCWFYIKQPFDFNKEQGFVARFNASSDRAYLNCNGSPTDSGASLGVRFKWRVK
jgi:hypothetical protein